MSVLLLDGVTTTGASNSWEIRRGAIEHTVQCTTTGNPTIIITVLEGSLDGETWYQLAAHNWTNGEITDQQAMFHVTSKFVTFIRINVEALSGGSSPSITCLYDGIFN